MMFTIRITIILSALFLSLSSSSALVVPFGPPTVPKFKWISQSSKATTGTTKATAHTVAVATIALLTVATTNVNCVHAADVNVSANANVAKGETLFQNNCSTCHKGGMNAIAKDRTLQKDALEQFLGSGSSSDVDTISNFVKNSNVHRGALAFGGSMTDDEFRDVSAFIVEKATTSENKW